MPTVEQMRRGGPALAGAGYSEECPLCWDGVSWPPDQMAAEAVRPLHEAGHPAGARLTRRAGQWHVVAA